MPRTTSQWSGNAYGYFRSDKLNSRDLVALKVLPYANQQIGGTLMAVSEAIVFFGLLAYFFVRFMAEEDAGYSHGDA